MGHVQRAVYRMERGSNDSVDIPAGDLRAAYPPPWLPAGRLAGYLQDIELAGACAE